MTPNCDFTEEVSLLVDDELAPHEAARLRAHMEGCTACKQAQEEFLLFREELRSYKWTPDPRAQGEALASILGSRASGADAASQPPAVGGLRHSTPLEAIRRLWERLHEATRVPGLRPSHAASFALLLVAAVLGAWWLMHSNNASLKHRATTSEVANANAAPAPAASRAGAAVEGREGSDSHDPAHAYRAEAPRPARPAALKPSRRAPREEASLRRDGLRTVRRVQRGAGLDLPQDVARVRQPAVPPSAASAAEFETPEGLGTADPAQRVGLHAERVERLLRSFRNARLTTGDPTLDVADARRLSKRLLYNNIALRREAASAGNLPVEGLLDSIEPTLLDISNLPDNPSPGAVGSIKERIRRRQLVGVLLVQAMLASRN